GNPVLHHPLARGRDHPRRTGLSARPAARLVARAFLVSALLLHDVFSGRAHHRTHRRSRRRAARAGIATLLGRRPLRHPPSPLDPRPPPPHRCRRIKPAAMKSLARYARIWLACARYSVVRTMMFRADFIMWSLVELFWMGVNLSVIGVVYQHTDSIAGWGPWEMTLLVGSSMLVQRLLMGLFWTNLFEMGRNVRTGHFDFFLAQPGNPLFMVSTRKIDLDGFLNVPVAIGVVAYAAHRLGLEPSPVVIAAYALLILCGLVIHYATLLIFISLVFWVQSAKGIEGGYFGLNEFSRLPREALRGVGAVVLV